MLQTVCPLRKNPKSPRLQALVARWYGCIQSVQGVVTASRSGCGSCIYSFAVAGGFKAGTMEGVGAVMSGGARFQGHWSRGMCDGLGKAAFADGSMYDG